MLKCESQHGEGNQRYLRVRDNTKEQDKGRVSEREIHREKED